MKAAKGQWYRWIPELLPDAEVRVVAYSELTKRIRVPCHAGGDEETCPSCKGRGYHLRGVPDPELIKWHPDIKIIDEAHRAKNRKAQWTQALRKIKSRLSILLTGTPIINEPAELWSLLNLMFPSSYRSYWAFFNEFVAFEHHTKSKHEVCPICDNWHQREFRVITGVKNAEKLRAEIAPFTIRRMKKGCMARDCPEGELIIYYEGTDGVAYTGVVSHDHLEGLPDILPPKVYEVELDPKQRRAYDEMRREALAWVGQYEDQPLPAPIAIAQLTRLRQFTGAYIEYVRTDEYEWDDIARNPYAPDKMLIRQPGDFVYRMTEPSSKLDTLMDILADTGDSPIVVFSMFRQLVDLACTRFDKAGIPHFRLTGNTPNDQRQDWQRFQAGGRRVFIATLQAGGAGIDLFRASTVVFLDRSFSPADNYQAVGRLWRAGQTRGVLPIYIQAKDTVDEAVEETLQFKVKIIREILGG